MLNNNSYRYLPEWREQKGTILIFPKRGSDWNCCFDRAVKSFTHLIKAIAKYQKVYLILEEDITLDIPNVEIIKGVKTNDTWARDSLGLTVFHNEKRYILNYQFNGWGNKFDSSLDNKITENLFQKNLFQDSKLINSPLIIEGGAVETDGKVLLVTETSILNINRGQKDSRKIIENSFRKYLGVSEIIWLKNSFLAGDDTDGHIDMLARFGENGEILYFLDEVGDEIMESLPNRKYIKFPTPSFEDFPTTYLNFIFVNGGILFPTYGVKEDMEAMEIFRTTFPKRDIIPIDSRTFIQQGGSLHCLTMQLY